MSSRVAVSTKLALLLVLSLSACAPSTSDRVEDRDLLATWDTGTIVRADLDQAILAMPADRRALAGKQDGWYGDLVRELALDAILLEEAEMIGLAEERAIAATLEEQRRQVLVELFQERMIAPPEGVTEEELQRAYKSAGERFHLQAARRVRHIFKRREPSRDLDQQIAQVGEWREQVLAGASFASLAAEHSESESRHMGGELGLLRRSGLPEELAEIIFSLPEGSPSEPIVTAEGIHLFLVEKAHEERLFRFDEVRVVLEREELMRRRNEALDQAAEELPPLPPGGFRADEKELEQLISAGNREASVLRVGDLEESLGRLLERLTLQEIEASPAMAAAKLEQLERRERVVRYAEGERWLEEPEVTNRLQALRRRELIRRQRESRLEQSLDISPERLRQFYELDAMRFSTPVKMRLQLLSVPFTDISQANALMQGLEAQVLAGSGKPLATLADELGGDAQELDWLTLTELASAQPRIARRVADLRQGERSSPLLADETLVLAEVLERREPAKVPFSQVLDQVRDAYLESHGREVYDEWASERLESAGFQLVEKSIADLAAHPSSD